MPKLLYCAILGMATMLACSSPTPTSSPPTPTANPGPRRDMMLSGLPGAEISSPQEAAVVIDCPGDNTLRQVTLQTGTAPGEGWGETTTAGEPGPVAPADVVDAPRFFALLRSILGWRGI